MLERVLNPEAKMRIFYIRDRFRGIIRSLVKSVGKLEKQVARQEEIRKVRKEVEGAKHKEELLKMVLEKNWND